MTGLMYDNPRAEVFHQSVVIAGARKDLILTLGILETVGANEILNFPMLEGWGAVISNVLWV